MKDCNYSNDATIKITELAVIKKIVKIVPFNRKDLYGIVLQVVKKKEMILVPDTQ